MENTYEIEYLMDSIALCQNKFNDFFLFDCPEDRDFIRYRNNICAERTCSIISNNDRVISSIEDFEINNNNHIGEKYTYLKNNIPIKKGCSNNFIEKNCQKEHLDNKDNEDIELKNLRNTGCLVNNEFKTIDSRIIEKFNNLSSKISKIQYRNEFLSSNDLKLRKTQSLHISQKDEENILPLVRSTSFDELLKDDINLFKGIVLNERGPIDGLAMESDEESPRKFFKPPNSYNDNLLFDGSICLSNNILDIPNLQTNQNQLITNYSSSIQDNLPDIDSINTNYSNIYEQTNFIGSCILPPTFQEINSFDISSTLAEVLLKKGHSIEPEKPSLVLQINRAKHLHNEFGEKIGLNPKFGELGGNYLKDSLKHSDQFLKQYSLNSPNISNSSNEFAISNLEGNVSYSNMINQSNRTDTTIYDTTQQSIYSNKNLKSNFSDGINLNTTLKSIEDISLFNQNFTQDEKNRHSNILSEIILEYKEATDRANKPSRIENLSVEEYEQIADILATSNPACAPNLPINVHTSLYNGKFNTIISDTSSNENVLYSSDEIKSSNNLNKNNMSDNVLISSQFLSQDIFMNKETNNYIHSNLPASSNHLIMPHMRSLFTTSLDSNADNEVIKNLIQNIDITMLNQLVKQVSENKLLICNNEEYILPNTSASSNLILDSENTSILNKIQNKPDNLLIFNELIAEQKFQIENNTLPSVDLCEPYQLKPDYIQSNTADFNDLFYKDCTNRSSQYDYFNYNQPNALISNDLKEFNKYLYMMDMQSNYEKTPQYINQHNDIDTTIYTNFNNQGDSYNPINNSYQAELTTAINSSLLPYNSQTISLDNNYRSNVSDIKSTPATPLLIENETDKNLFGFTNNKIQGNQSNILDVTNQIVECCESIQNNSIIEYEGSRLDMTDTKTMAEPIKALPQSKIPIMLESISDGSWSFENEAINMNLNIPDLKELRRKDNGREVVLSNSHRPQKQPTNKECVTKQKNANKMKKCKNVDIKVKNDDKLMNNSPSLSLIPKERNKLTRCKTPSQTSEILLESSPINQVPDQNQKYSDESGNSVSSHDSDYLHNHKISDDSLSSPSNSKTFRILQNKFEDVPNLYLEKSFPPINNEELWAEEKLIMSKIKNLSEQNEDGDSWLHTAVIAKNFYLLQSLLNRIKQENAHFIIDLPNNLSQTAFALSIITNQLKMVQLLLDVGANSNVRLLRNRNPNSFNYPLHLLASRGNPMSTQILRILLKDQRLNIDAFDSNGQTALICSIQAHDDVTNNTIANIQMLIEKGISLHRSDVGYDKTALHQAVIKKSLPICIIIIASLTQRNFTEDNGSLSASLRQLLDAKTMHGNTALHLAVARLNKGVGDEAIMTQRRIVQLLLTYGIDPSIRNFEGKLAREVTDDEVIKDLLTLKNQNMNRIYCY